LSEVKTKARIYRPTKTAMQSGVNNTKQWLLEYEPGSPATIEPLMGWTSSADTRRQLRLWFETKEEALTYAQKEGLSYEFEEPRERAVRPKSYADNFRFDRIGRWSH
jgi:ETC complex I subunit-like protein